MSQPIILKSHTKIYVCVGMKYVHWENGKGETDITRNTWPGDIKSNGFLALLDKCENDWSKRYPLKDVSQEQWMQEVIVPYYRHESYMAGTTISFYRFRAYFGVLYAEEIVKNPVITEELHLINTRYRDANLFWEREDLMELTNLYYKFFTNNEPLPEGMDMWEAVKLKELKLWKC